VACCGRTLSNVETVASEISKTGGRASGYAVDVANGAQVTEVCEKIVKDFGRVDVLVNNAGVTRDQLLMRMSDEDWDAVLDTNLKGAFHFTKAVTRTMLKQRSGRIVNISSIIGLTGNAGQSNYAASKAGLIGFTKSVARELASRSITANAVAPGFIETDMTAALGAEATEAVKSRIALGRLGTGEDVANAVLFLVSELGSYVTGQVITVDGGLAI
jgi:3-oxoacyl-[acyl-carrier protein] reductase